MRDGIFSSLVARLTLAVLAVLVLSLGVTTAVFVAQSHDSTRVAAYNLMRQNRLSVRGDVCRSLLSAGAQRPLAYVPVGALGIDRVLLTRWPDDRVVGDTAADGAAPSPPFAMPINYQGRMEIAGETTIGAVNYAYYALADSFLVCNLTGHTAYHSVIMLAKVAPLALLTWTVLGQLLQPGLVALLISMVAALLVLRAMTRSLQEMTRASESMARGDYDQRVTRADASDEIGQLARAFNRMAYEVKRAREAQRQFVANVSHDLRSPLTSIIGFSQILTEDDAATPKQRRVASIINDEAERLHRLTVDLLDLSRLEAGRLPLSRQVLNLNDLLNDIAARYAALPNARGVTFTADLCARPLPVSGDRDRLIQVVVNLVDNAFKFCNAGGDVRLSSRASQGQACMTVRNTGAGIPTEDLPRVFDRFYRGDHSRAQQTGGSGIGLAIVRELVHAHGGQVVADSEIGRSTTITVTLPIAVDDFTKDLQHANTGATTLAL